MDKYLPYANCIDSGIDWLGEVPAHWEIKKLKFLASVYPSNVDKKTKEGEQPVRLCNYTDVYYNEQIDGTLDFMVASATYEQIEKFSLCAGDTILTKDSEDRDDIAVPAYVTESLPGVVCGYHLAMVRPKAPESGAYIKRFIESWYARSFFATQANGLTRYGLGTYPLNNIRVLFPPVDEARNIAAFLDHETAKIDRLIAKQERLIDLLKEKRQAVISHAVTKGLHPDAPMKDSGVEWLGEVPAHWEVMATKFVCSLIKDGTHLPPPRVADGVRLLSVRNIVGGRFVLREDDSMISEESYADLARSFVVKIGDVLLAIVGATLGKAAIVEELGTRFHIQRSLGVFRVREMLLRNEYLRYVFVSNGFQQLLWENVGFSAQPGIYLGALADFRIPVPGLSEQEAIISYLNEKVEMLDRLQAKAEASIQLMKEHRTALISSAVTGKIDVRGWQKPNNEPQAAATAASA